MGQPVGNALRELAQLGAGCIAGLVWSGMHDETLAIHGGYTPDSTRAVAVPIYQTVAHDFIDADHAGGDHGPPDPRVSLQPPQQSHG